MPRPSLYRTLILVAALSSPAAAETADVPSRTLEAVWKTAVPGENPDSVYFGLRLRVQADNQVSLAAGHVLVTLDGAGKVRHRAMFPLRKNEPYMSVPLAGGDFLVQPKAAIVGEVRLMRVSPDGRPRYTSQERLPKDILGLLHDALLLPNGRIVAAASYGLGPNAVLALIALDAQGRRVGDNRTTIFALASEGSTRLFPRINDGRVETVSVFGMGMRPEGSGPFRKTFTVDGDVPVATEAEFLGSPAALRCSAMSANGVAIVAAAEGESESKSVTLRWYDDAGELTEFLTVGEADQCQIAMRADGGSLVWLAPRTLLAFDADAKPLWRAALPEDGVAIGWTAEGDVVAVHSAAGGLAVARYMLP